MHSVTNLLAADGVGTAAGWIAAETTHAQPWDTFRVYKR